jgi:hypothetical protein
MLHAARREGKQVNVRAWARFRQADLSIPNESAYLQCVINFRIADHPEVGQTTHYKRVRQE